MAVTCHIHVKDEASTCGHAVENSRLNGLVDAKYVTKSGSNYISEVPDVDHRASLIDAKADPKSHEVEDLDEDDTPCDSHPRAGQDRARLFAALKGQRISIPNLNPITKTWPAAINPHYASMIAVANEFLTKILPTSPKLRKLQSADFALFASSWWPNATSSNLRILTYLMIWLFVWDDDLDQTGGNLSTDLEAATAYRRASIAFLERCLGFGNQATAGPPEAPSAIVESFRECADVLKEAYTEEQRRLFLDEMLYFVNMSQVEQQVRLSQRIPSLSEYWYFRLGTSAVRITTALIEFGNETTVPTSVQQSKDMQEIWMETNIIITTENDMLSLKKEMDLDGMNSLVPLSSAKSYDAQASVNKCVENLRASVGRFDTVAEKISHVYEGTDHAEIVERFVDGARYLCTGNLSWSLVTPRYNLGGDIDEKGDIQFVL